jgi:hypothetical protein
VDPEQPTESPRHDREPDTGEPAFAAWTRHRHAEGEPASPELFDRVYLGIYSAVDDYTSDLIDDYRLDARLDAAIGPPFRDHLDIDITALSQALVRHGALYALPAQPVGVWIFRTGH